MPSIEQFAKDIGILKPSKYTIDIISAPVTFVTGIGDDNSIIAESVTFPGRSIASIERRVTHGPIREMPYERLYAGDIEMVFAHEVDYVRMKVEEWMDIIISEDNVINSDYDKYSATIQISVLDEEDNSPVMFCRIKESWPKSINQVQLGYGMFDDYIKMSVSFSFREVEYFNS